MKAAILEGPNQLFIRDIPEPSMGEYDVLCEMLYGNTCPGTDTHIIECNFPFLGKLPTIIGHESIGRVVKRGAKVKSFKEGDLITRPGACGYQEYSSTWGGHAEYGIAKDTAAMRMDGVPPVDEWWWDNCLVVPPDIDPATATMIITWRETLSYCKRLGFAPGKNVLVIGSGANGLAFAAHAAHIGCARIAMAGSLSRREIGQKLGIQDYVDFRQKDWIEELSTRLPKGFDCVIDAVGQKDTLNQGLRLLQSGGVIGMYGLDDFGATSINPLAARGSFHFYNRGYSEAEAHDEVIALMRTGRLDARHWCDPDHSDTLENLALAYAEVKSRSIIKKVIRLRGS